MPRQSLRPRSERINSVATIALDFLTPSCAQQIRHISGGPRASRSYCASGSKTQHDLYEGFFLGAISQASRCRDHRVPSESARKKFFQRPFDPKQAKGDGQRPSRRVPGKLEPLQQTRRLSTNPGYGSSTSQRSSEDAFRTSFDTRAQRMAAQSRLPRDFFDDVFQIQLKVRDIVPEVSQSSPDEPFADHRDAEREGDEPQEDPETDLDAQIRLINSVRELEEKLAEAKAALKRSVQSARSHSASAKWTQSGQNGIKLSKIDYIGLVDLYYYSQRHRWGPEGPDYSPPLSFLSSHELDNSDVFEGLRTRSKYQAGDEDNEPPIEMHDDSDFYGSPLLDVEKTLISNQRREITIMQKFVDLLLDDESSNRDLYQAYKRFPHPGVAWLPKGIQRFFLQRMSTPWTRSRRAMLRYLSIIDDMQYARLPITSAEWSSAIYLAGRSVANVTMAEVDAAIVMWRKMERDAGVKATNVTFNILFDIAVRAGKYALAETFLKEMYARDLRLNRLGRVSMIFYHGVRGDGDAVRRTYRDFIDAGEIVDTLVLNCVIASLLRAREPSGAEQIYERMRDLQKRLVSGTRADGSETFYTRYPGPSAGGPTLEREMGPNALGRILQKAPHLQKILPDHHTDLQDIMPLRPDHITFRALISYHANVSGDLDRVTVLLKEMTEEFKLPIRSVFFLLLFKGFALHGGSRGHHTKWTFQRLELAWDACRKAIIEARVAKRAARKAAAEAENEANKVSAAHEGEELSLPKITEVNAGLSQRVEEKSPPEQKQKQMSSWDKFVLDMAAFPHDRRKPIEEFQAQLDDDENAQPTGFPNPFFPNPEIQRAPTPRANSYYTRDQNENLDHEDGDYVLPPPSRMITHEILEHESPDMDLRMGGLEDGEKATIETTKSSTDQDGSSEDPTEAESPSQPSEENEQPDIEDEAQQQEPPDDYAQYVTSQSVVANRQMVCWLLRAYTQCTGSRAKVEEIWGAIRKVYIPLDEAENKSVVRVLQRCLKHCDQYSPYLL